MRTGGAEERGTNPLVCRQWRGLYQFMYRSAQGLFISIARPSESTGDQRICPSSFCLRCENPIPLLSSPVLRRSQDILCMYTSFIFPPTFQLVELELGWCKPAHPLQRWTHYETITIAWRPKSRVKTHKSPPSQDCHSAQMKSNLMRAILFKGVW